MDASSCGYPQRVGVVRKEARTGVQQTIREGGQLSQSELCCHESEGIGKVNPREGHHIPRCFCFVELYDQRVLGAAWGIKSKVALVVALVPVVVVAVRR